MATKTQSNTKDAATGRIHILKLSAKNVKTLRAVEIDEFGEVLAIKGDTGQGKTSILEAIEGGLAGLDPNMVRRGSDSAEIIIELDTARISRIIKADGGKDTLTVTDRASGKPIEKAKEFLKALLPDNLMFRPLEFVQLGGGDGKGRTERLRQQRNMLLDAMPVRVTPDDVAERIQGISEEAFKEASAVDLGGVDFEQHGLAVCNALEKVFYDARKLHNSRAEEAEGALKHVPPPARPAPKCSAQEANRLMDVARDAYYKAKAQGDARQATMTRKQQIEESIARDRQAYPYTRQDLLDAQRDQTEIETTCKARIQRLKQELAVAEQELSGAQSAIQEVGKALAAHDRIEAGERELAQINESLGGAAAPEVDELKKRLDNATADRDARLLQDKHDAAAKAATAARERAALYDAMVELFRDTMPKLIVESMAMPVPGLGIEGGVVCFKGIPLHQLGTSEQLRIAVMLAAALNPRTGFILIDRAESLGSKDTKALVDAAREIGLQLILTYVDPLAEPSPGTIVMRDGERVA